MRSLLVDAGVLAVVSAELADMLDADSVAVLAAADRAQAADGGLWLLGPDGLPAEITKRVLEAALEAELEEHLATEATACAGPKRGRRVRPGV